MNDSLVISGYALCWNERIFIDKGNEQFYEQFQRGAFTETIKKGNQKLLYYHDKIYEAKCKLTLMEDEKGLAFRAELKNNGNGRPFYNLVRYRGVNHVSIGFRNAKYELSKYRHFPFRKVVYVDLDEISLVIYPAYTSSSVGIGCSNEQLNLMAQIDKVLNGL